VTLSLVERPKGKNNYVMRKAVRPAA